MPGIHHPPVLEQVEDDQNIRDPIIIVEERNFEDFDLGDEGWRRVVFVDANNSDREQKQKVIDYSEHLVQLYGTMQVLKDSIKHYFREAWAEFDRTVCHIKYYYINSAGDRIRLISDFDAVLALVAKPYAIIEFDASRPGKQIPTTSQQKRSRELLKKKAEEEAEYQAFLEEDRALAERDRRKRKRLLIDKSERLAEEERRRYRPIRNATYLAEEKSDESESEESDEEIPRTKFIKYEVPSTCPDLIRLIDFMGLQHLNLEGNCNKGEENVQAERDAEEVQNVQDRPAIEIFLDVPLKVYQDFLTRDVMFDHSNEYNLVEHGILYEVFGDYIDQNNTIDLIRKHGLREVTNLFNSRASYKRYLAYYVELHLVPRLENYYIEQFKTEVRRIMNRVLENFQVLKFYTGSSLDPNCMIGLLEVREGRPVFLFFKDGLDCTYRVY